MRTETTTRNIYTWDESSAEQQEKALDKLYDINVDYDWWESTYDDATTIGLKITGFNIDRGNSIDGNLLALPEDVITAILDNHGDQCDTYKLAQEYRDKVGENEDGDRIDEDEDDNFLYALKEEYLSILRKEYDYLTSREAIVETIEANQYEFDENGNLA